MRYFDVTYLEGRLLLHGPRGAHLKLACRRGILRHIQGDLPEFVAILAADLQTHLGFDGPLLLLLHLLVGTCQNAFLERRAEPKTIARRRVELAVRLTRAIGVLAALLRHLAGQSLRQVELGKWLLDVDHTVLLGLKDVLLRLHDA